VAIGALTVEGGVEFMGRLLAVFLQSSLNAPNGLRSYTRRFRLRPNVSPAALLRSLHAGEIRGS
jgi:hypothetical protein